MKIFSLKIGKITRITLLKELEKLLQDSHHHTGKLLFTPNPEICLKMRKDEEFLKTLQQADYLTSDGIGLYLAYQINDFLEKDQQNPPTFWKRIGCSMMLPYFVYNILFQKTYLYKTYGDRITGSGLTKDLLDICERSEIPITVLDLYKPQDSAKVASQKVFVKRLKEVHPRLQCDYFVYREEEQAKVFQHIRSSSSRVVFTTLGMKQQEVLALQVRNTCKNIRLSLAVGSAFDYIIGFQKPAPEVYKKLGFEWLYRLVTSPNRVQRIGRIYRAVIVFPLSVGFFSGTGNT